MKTGQFTVRIPIKDRAGNVKEWKEVVKYEGLLAQAHEEGLSLITTELVQAPCEENRNVAIVKATVQTSKGTFYGLGDASPDNVSPMVARHVLRVAETRAKARALRDAVNIGMVALEELGSECDEADTGTPENASSRSTAANTKAAPSTRPDPNPAPRSAVDAGVRSNGNGSRGTSMPTRKAGSSGGSDLRSPESADGNGHGDNTGNGARAFVPMTEAQRKLLFRLAFNRGHQGEQATKFLMAEFDVESLRHASKSAASALIDRLQDPFDADWSRREREMPAARNGSNGSNGAGVHHA